MEPTPLRHPCRDLTYPVEQDLKTPFSVELVFTAPLTRVTTLLALTALIPIPLPNRVPLSVVFVTPFISGIGPILPLT